MGEKAAFVYSDALTRHVLSENHPLKAVRLRYTYELLEAYGAFDAPGASLVKPRPATDEEVLAYHTKDYLEGYRAFLEKRRPNFTGE